MTTNRGQFKPGRSGNPTGRPPRQPTTAITRTDSTQRTQVTRRDGWINSASGHGTSRDRRTLTRFGVDVVTDLEALQLWRSEFLAAAIIEQLPKEALRRPWHLKCEDKELAEALCAQAEALDMDERMIEAWEKANAGGGSAIFPVMSGALDDLSTPLDEGAIVSVDALHVFEARELLPVDYYGDISSPKFRTPMTWRLIPLTSGRSGFIRPTIIHETRLVIFPGTRVSAQTQPGQREGWGDSKLCRPRQVMADFGLAWASAATLLHEYGKGTLEMDGFADMMAQADGLDEFDRHISAMEMAWSTLGMMVTDAKSRFSRSTGSLTGVSDVLNEFKTLMAAACERPVSILMGEGKTGLRTGEDDTRAWNATVERDRWKILHPRHRRLMQLLMLATAGPTSGVMPEAWSIEYPSLITPNEKEIAESRKIDMDRAVAAVDAGIASADDVAESFYGGDTYSPDIVIDWDRRKAQAEVDAQGVDDMSPEDMAAMGADYPVNEEMPTDPEEGGEPRQDSAAAVGHGYNPYRASDGKFGSGAHHTPAPHPHAGAGGDPAAAAAQARHRAYMAELAAKAGGQKRAPVAASKATRARAAPAARPAPAPPSKVVTERTEPPVGKAATAHAAAVPSKTTGQHVGDPAARNLVAQDARRRVIAGPRTIHADTQYNTATQFSPEAQRAIREHHNEVLQRHYGLTNLDGDAHVVHVESDMKVGGAQSYGWHDDSGHIGIWHKVADNLSEHSRLNAEQLHDLGQKALAGDKKSVAMIDAYRVSTHEAAHGHGPKVASAWVMDNEVSTELVARKVAGDVHGIPAHQMQGSYDRYIVPAVNVLAKESGKSYQEAYNALTAASFHLKRMPADRYHELMGVGERIMIPQALKALGVSDPSAPDRVHEQYREIDYRQAEYAKEHPSVNRYQ